MKTVWLQGQPNIKDTGSVLLFGGFDGLHAGHKKLLETAKKYRLPIGITTIFGCKNSDTVFTAEERREIFKNAGFAFVCETTFEDIKDVQAETFAETLKNAYNVKNFVCGTDFRFGKGATGTPETLGKTSRVDVEEILTQDGEKISSTAVKKYLADGDIEKVNSLLGDKFFLIGEVVEGRQVGRKLGFPTANIAYPQGKFALKKGVYETRVTLDGKTYFAITNYGARPTFDNGQVLTETYIDGYTGNLYAAKIKVEFVRFLREITKFNCVDDLRAQLEEDIRRVREND